MNMSYVRLVFSLRPGFEILNNITISLITPLLIHHSTLIIHNSFSQYFLLFTFTFLLLYPLSFELCPCLLCRPFSLRPGFKYVIRPSLFTTHYSLHLSFSPSFLRKTVSLHNRITFYFVLIILIPDLSTQYSILIPFLIFC